MMGFMMERGCNINCVANVKIIKPHMLSYSSRASHKNLLKFRKMVNLIIHALTVFT